MLLLWIIFFSVLGSIGAVITAGAFLLFKDKIQKILIPCLISYAIGALLTSGLLVLIPHAVEQLDIVSVLFTVLIGIVCFFVLEKMVIWRHCHNKECKVHASTGPLIIIGDAFHNFTDGIIIAASFMISVPVGIATSLAIIAHEIPQEVGDFGILLHSGYSRKKALFLNIISGSATLFAAILSYYALSLFKPAIPYIMAISASSFIYIALADLLPELHAKTSLGSAIKQFLFILIGILTIVLLLKIHH